MRRKRLALWCLAIVVLLLSACVVPTGSGGVAAPAGDTGVAAAPEAPAAQPASDGETPIQGEQLEPPFGGTIFISADIITSSDPTTYQGVTYTGQEMRTMFDRRVDGWIRVKAYLFMASFDDGLTAEIQVNPEFGSMDAALAEAERYGEVIGQLPTVLRTDVETVWIHRGIQLFGGGNNNLLIHTGQAAIYEATDILEETLVHEAAHTSLDAAHAAAPAWLTAQLEDGVFISTYARDFPEREDVAESFLLYLAVRYRSGRIPQSLIDTIVQTIPNRIAYFDSQSFNIYPLQTETVMDGQFPPLLRQTEENDASALSTPTPYAPSMLAPDDLTTAEDRPLSALRLAKRGNIFNTAPDMVIDLTKRYQATIVTTQGELVFALYSDIAPVAVNNFVLIASLGFYDGTLINHVSEAGIIIGSPRNHPDSHVGYFIPGEIGIEREWGRGALAYLPPLDPNTDERVHNGSLLLIVGESLSLELADQISYFGELVEGQEILNELTLEDRIEIIRIDVGEE
jgi:cyclophilin family peptidyl-prolyl cis-trans isomerase